MPASRLIQAIVTGVAVVSTGTGVVPYVSLPPKTDVILATQAQTNEYMPLRSGRRLTYESVLGDRFSLTFGAPIAMTWFDGTRRELVPVHDTRCDCRVLMRQVNGEVRAVGSLTEGQTYQWGEYIVVAPAAVAGGKADPVETPAGVFRQAVRVDMGGGPVWFAPGVGIVKTSNYQLVKYEGYH